MTESTPRRLRSQLWFDDPSHADLTALYVERYMNQGLTRAELQSGRPIIGIAQTGSDLTPCNRHHIELAKLHIRHMVGGHAAKVSDVLSPISFTLKHTTPVAAKPWAFCFLAGLIESVGAGLLAMASPPVEHFGKKRNIAPHDS